MKQMTKLLIIPLLFTAVAAAAPADPPLRDKTLVVWAAPANLEQRGGSALTIDAGQGLFDGIVFGEHTPRKWMPGSEGWRRTQPDQGEWPAETADGKTFVQIAIAYQDRQMTIYRNGRRYAQYVMANPPMEFGPQSKVLIGKRHLDVGEGGRFAGTIDDARIYDRALTAEQIAALKPNVASEIKPWAWLTFGDNQAKDRTGRFTEVKLVDGATVADGKLVLDGKNASMLASIKGMNPAAIPVPRGDGWWMDLHNSFNQRVKQGNVDLVFIGDSITYGWREGGQDTWAKYYGSRHAVNLGIGGDTTQFVLWRLTHGNLDGISPKLAVIMIGTNNGQGNTPEETAEGVTAIVREVRARCPKSKILLLAIFPRGHAADDGLRKKNEQVNAIISKLDNGKNIFYLDIGSKFLDKNGVLPRDIMPDLLHPNQKGYDIWAEAIEPKVMQIMGDKAITPIKRKPLDAGPEWAMGPFVKLAKPVLSPTPESKFQCPLQGKEVRWEEQNVYNPAVVVRDGKVYLLYRADDKCWWRFSNDDQATSRIGLASSEDGRHFTRHPVPVVFPDKDAYTKYEWPGGCQDLHVVEGEDGAYYMNYTAWGEGGFDSMGVASSKDLIHWQKHGPAFRKTNPANLKSRSGVVITRLAGERQIAAKINGKYWMYYTQGSFNCALAWSENLIDWTRADKSVWGNGHEAGAIALRQDNGILIFFNSQDWWGRSLPRGSWTLGQALVDRENLTTVLQHQYRPFLQPEFDWEMKGYCSVPATVANGLVFFKGEWLLYYGGADRHIGLAVSTPETKDIVIADFEGNDYGEWKATGDAFGAGPAHGTLPTQQPVAGFLGKGLVNSFRDGDRTIGTLTSPAFTIQRKHLSFLIGGGDHPHETCLNLIIDGQIVRTETGQNSERLETCRWDIVEFAGKQAILQIVDKNTGGWGHIMIDQIVQTDKEMPALTQMEYSCPSVNKRFIHIPISSDARTVWVNVSVDGVSQRELSISLARNKPDFYATLDLGPWQGKQLTLTAEKVYSDSQWSKLIKLSDDLWNDDTVYTEKYRPQFHFTVRHGGIGDPNGLVYFGGEYHLFGQHCHFNGERSAGMESTVWAHAISSDLFHWVEYPLAVLPDKLGVPFSGSGVVDWKNTAGLVKNPVKDKNGRLENPAIVILYTSEPMRTRHGGNTSQSMAYSLDAGRTWITYPGNPVVPSIVNQNRDPKVFWYEDRKNPRNPNSGRWIMALYLSGPNYALLASKDLIHWERIGGISNIGCVECPDMFELPVDGNKEDTRWVFWGGNGNHVIGTFDGQTFTKQSGPFSTHAGNEYAAQTFSDTPEKDGRRIQLADLYGDTFPGMLFKNQFTIPRDLTLRTTPAGMRLFIEPAKEIEKLRTGAILQIDGPLVGMDAPLKADKTLGELVDAEAVFEIQSDALSREGANVFGLKINGQTILCDLDQKQLKVRDLVAPLGTVDRTIKLRVILDRMSIEVFVDDGAFRFTKPFVPEDGMKQDLQVFGKQGLAAVHLRAYQLQSIWRNSKPVRQNASQ